MLDTFVDQIASSIVIANKNLQRILLLLNEAVINAIEHGNNCDPNKKVTIHCLKKHDNAKLCFKICDEGCGFDFTKLKNPTLSENITNEGGRGVYIIQKMSNGYFFENNGSTITFCVDITDAV
jgi:Anti-sigma regulatory factor (Ser/Thr protein kinase)